MIYFEFCCWKNLKRYQNLLSLMFQCFWNLCFEYTFEKPFINKTVTRQEQKFSSLFSFQKLHPNCLHKAPSDHSSSFVPCHESFNHNSSSISIGVLIQQNFPILVHKGTFLSFQTKWESKVAFVWSFFKANTEFYFQWTVTTSDISFWISSVTDSASSFLVCVWTTWVDFLLKIPHI